MAKLRSVVASTKGSVSGPSAREPLTPQMGLCVNGPESRYPAADSGRRSGNPEVGCPKVANLHRPCRSQSRNGKRGRITCEMGIYHQLSED
jgi:hypothetical protein